MAYYLNAVNRCAVAGCKGSVTAPSSTVHLCDLCKHKHIELLCDCIKDYVYLNGQCGECWIKTQRKNMPSWTKKAKRVSIDTVAKMRSQPREPKHRRVEAVIDISGDDEGQLNNKVKCKHEGCKESAMHKNRDFCEDHCEARDYLDEEAAEEDAEAEYLAEEEAERNRLEADLDKLAEPKKKKSV
jgi:hypothetical protein